MTFFAKAPGKCILFGEHSVVHGYPAIATAIGRYSKCEIQSNENANIRLILKNYNHSISARSLSELNEKIEPRYRQFANCLTLLNKRHGISFNGITFTLSSELFPSAGLGSSASASVSFIGAIGGHFDLKLNDSKISDLAFKMEREVHGTPSGIDNTICTFGKTLRYQKDQFKQIPVHSHLKLMVTYTNMIHETKKAIQRINTLKNRNPKLIEEIFKAINLIVNQAEMELIKGNIKKLGALLNKNQQYLEKMNVSNDTISEVISIASANGALGSKLTGAGLGGCVISIAPEKDLGNLSKLMNQKGYSSFITSINKGGVQLGKSG